MRVSAGVREDKDPTDSLPACATCISLRRSRCAQIRAKSIAARTAACFSRRGTKRFWWRMATDGWGRTRGGGEGNGRIAGGWKKWRWGREWVKKMVRRRTCDERPQSTQHRPAKIAPLPLSEYTRNILSTRVFHAAARPPRWVKGSRTPERTWAPEEEKRAREEPHDRPCSIVLHHEKRPRELRLHLSSPPRDPPSSRSIRISTFRVNVLIRFTLSHDAINFACLFHGGMFSVQKRSQEKS